MKKVYRILCLVLAMVMLLSVSSVMAESKIFSDVKETGKYSEAIYTLTDFGIIKGDAGADTFRPEANISREEFSVIMTRFLGVADLPVNTSTYPFNDVTPETCADWSIKATKIAYDMGIISGYGDGNFGPKDPVTYEQAVKMIVCALGYEKAAIKLGGWPTGYLTVAINNKITAGAEYANSQPAPRQIIAQLIYNSLEVNRVSDTATDPNEKNTILSDVLKLKKEKGVITANGITSVDSSGSSIKEDQIEIDVKNVSPRPIFNAGTTNAADYLGKQVNFFYKEENGENILVSARPTNSNKSVTFEAEYIKSISSSKVEIYDDPDDQTDFDEYALSSPKAVYNGKYYSGTIDSTLIPTFGSITLMDYTGDGKYDLIDIKNTRIFVVSTVDTANNRIYNRYQQSDILSIAPTSQVTMNVTKGGQPSNVSAIKVDDVLLVAESRNQAGKRTVNIEIVTNKTTGKVTACNTSQGLFTIAGKTYEAANAYMTYAANNPISIGDEINFWVNENDIILYAEVNSSTASSSYSYGYILGAEKKTTGATAGNANVHLFTASGKEVTYRLASNVSINGVPCTTPDLALTALDTANNTITNLDSPTGTTTYCQLIKYAVNTSGDISIILTAEVGTTATFNANKLTRATAYNSNAVKYSATSGMLGNVLVDNSTVIFNVPTDRDDTEDYTVDKTSSLTTSLSYNFEAYDANQGVAKIIVIYGSNSASATSPTAPVIIVSDIRETTNKDGDIVHQVTDLKDGKKYKAINRSLLSSYQAGDVITVAFDSAGDINDAKLIYSSATQTISAAPAGTSTDVAPAGSYSLYMGGDKEGTIDAEFMTVSGTVSQRFDTQMFVAVNQMVDGSGNLNTANMQPVKFSGETVYYIFNPSNGKFTTGTYGNIFDFTNTSAGASKVFSFSSKGETKFIIIVNP